MPSKFVIYNTRVRGFLVKFYDWDKEAARKWLLENREEVRVLFSKGLSSGVSARFINAKVRFEKEDRKIQEG